MSIYINDVWYDVSHFKHPGGHVIKHYYENDATDVFNALHFRSKKAKKVLRLWPRKRKSKMKAAATFTMIRIAEK